MIVNLWALNIPTLLIFMQSYEVPLSEEAANGEIRCFARDSLLVSAEPCHLALRPSKCSPSLPLCRPDL